MLNLFHGDSDGKESACSAGDQDSILRSGRSLEKGMTTHSIILAWKIPWTEEPSGLQSKLDMTEQLTLFFSTSPKIGYSISRISIQFY